MNLQVGVKVLIKNSGNEYLLIQRAAAMDNEQTAHWDIPGGRIESDEPLLEALAREVKEETGLVLTGEPHLIGAQDIFVPQKDLHVVRLTYQVDGDGEITLSNEHQNATWVSTEAIHETQLDPYLRKLIDTQKDA